MDRLTGKMLSTLLRDATTGDSIIRVSLWANPEAVEILEDDSGRSTIKVKVQKGRTTVYGTIDRDAYRHWLTVDEASLVPDVPVPTDSIETSKVLSAFVGSSKPRTEGVPRPAPISRPLFSRAKEVA